MFFIGIDIGKRHHEVALIDGNVIGKTIRIANTKHGSEKLIDFFNKHNLTPNNTMIGMEATGHYWLSIYSFFNKLDFQLLLSIPFNRMFYVIFISVKLKPIQLMLY